MAIQRGDKGGATVSRVLELFQAACIPGVLKFGIFGIWKFEGTRLLGTEKHNISMNKV
jgi:hypothetical protein